jgi:hypothetical protein
MIRTVSSVIVLSSPAFWDEVVESKVSFPVSVGEDGRDGPPVGTTSGPSSSSEITISPSRAGVRCASVVVGTSGLLSLSNRYLIAVAIPAVLSGAEVVDVAVCSPGESSGEPKVV